MTCFGKDRYAYRRLFNLAVSPRPPGEDNQLIGASITLSICYAETLSELLPDSPFTVFLLQAPTRDTATVTGDQKFAWILPFSQTTLCTAMQYGDAEVSRNPLYPRR